MNACGVAVEIICVHSMGTSWQAVLARECNT